LKVFNKSIVPREFLKEKKLSSNNLNKNNIQKKQKKKKKKKKISRETFQEVAIAPQLWDGNIFDRYNHLKKNQEFVQEPINHHKL
jgi:hypothetical protein